MDKEFLERVSIGIQLLGYGLFIYLVNTLIDNYGHSVFSSFSNYGSIYEWIIWAYGNSGEGHIVLISMCFVAPRIIRWMLTGKIKFLPVVFKED